MSIMRLVPDTGADRPAAQIAGRVRAVMAEHQLSSARVASAIGMTPPAFSRRYSGELDWSIAQLASLAEAFGMSFNDLCAIRDLNPEPADSEPSRSPLTLLVDDSPNVVVALPLHRETREVALVPRPQLILVGAVPA